MNKLSMIVAVLFLAACSTQALAHPGALDSDGGHWDNATGTYHFHQDAQGNKFDIPLEAGKGHKPGEKAESTSAKPAKPAKAEVKPKAAKKPKRARKLKKGDSK